MNEFNVFEVDRESESNEICKYIYGMLNNINAPKILLIFGNSKIGKTICINKAIQKIKKEFDYIAKIDNEFQSDENSFYEKLYNLMNKNKLKSVLLKMKIKVGINLGITFESEIPNLYNYKVAIKKLLNNKKTLFHIQLEKELLASSEFYNFFKYLKMNNFIILEISNIDILNSIKKILDNKQFTYNILKIKPIDIKFLKNILSSSEVFVPNDKDLNIKFKKCKYSITSLINDLYRKTPKKENNFPISDLAKESQILMLIIFMWFNEGFKYSNLSKIICNRYNKKLMTSEIYSFFKKSKNLKKILYCLEDKNVISFRRKKYIINKTYTEIMRNYIENNNSNINIILVYKILLHYTHPSNTSKINKNFYNIYINSMIVGDNNSIFNYFEIIKKLEKNRYKKILINLGNYIISSLKKGIYEKYPFKIDKIIFELIKINELDIAYQIFKQIITENSSNHFILKISFKNANSKYFANESFEKLIDEGKIYGKKFEIYAEYVYVCYLYKNKNTDCGINYARKLIDKYKTQELTNEQKLILSFIYKNYSSYLDIKSSIEYLNKAISLLKEIKQHSIIPKINISLSILYARMFKFSKAFKLTKQVYRKIKSNKIPFKYEYYYNNYSIIYLFQRKTNERVEKFLYNALELTSSILERAMILSNLLIHFVFKKKYEKCHEILKELDELEYLKFSNERIKYAILTNALFFYKKINNKENIEKINSILREILNSPGCSQEMIEIIKYQLGESNNVSSSFKHVVDLGYKPARIGYYTFDDSINLINDY